MADQFISEIRIFPYSDIPSGWLPCDGRLLPSDDKTYQMLSLQLGTSFGGDGKTTFGIPNLIGAVPMGTGGGPNRTYRERGDKGGEEMVGLLSVETPGHTHMVANQGPPGDSSAPGGKTFARAVGATPYAIGVATTMMSLESIGEAGSGDPHNNMQPYLALNFCIAYEGQFPGVPP